MLVLSRRPGSAIVIDHHIRVTVELVSKDDVCLRVERPPGVTVERREEVEMRRQLGAAGTGEDIVVLSRRPRPALILGGKIELAVLAISSDGVRIGVDAPPDMEVHREEVYLQIRQANQSAVAAGDNDLASLAPYVGGTPTGSATP